MAWKHRRTTDSVFAALESYMCGRSPQDPRASEPGIPPMAFPAPVGVGCERQVVDYSVRGALLEYDSHILAQMPEVWHSDTDASTINDSAICHDGLAVNASWRSCPTT